MTDSEKVAALIFNGLSSGLTAVNAFVPLPDRLRVAADIHDQLREGGVEIRVATEPAKPIKPRDLGPQTFGPAPGPDGNTEFWDKAEDEGA